MNAGEDSGYVPLAVVGKELSAGVGEGVGAYDGVALRNSSQ